MKDITDIEEAKNGYLLRSLNTQLSKQYGVSIKKTSRTKNANMYIESLIKWGEPLPSLEKGTDELNKEEKTHMKNDDEIAEEMGYNVPMSLEDMM